MGEHDVDGPDGGAAVTEAGSGALGTGALVPKVRAGGALTGVPRHVSSGSRRLLLIRVLVVLTVLLGANYVGWRWLVNWSAWPIAVPLVLAETYSFLDALLFGTTMWRLRERGEAPPPPAGATVDVFITTTTSPSTW